MRLCLCQPNLLKLNQRKAATCQKSVAETDANEAKLVETKAVEMKPV